MEEPNFWLRDFAKVRFAFLLSLSVGIQLVGGLETDCSYRAIDVQGPCGWLELVFFLETCLWMEIAFRRGLIRCSAHL